MPACSETTTISASDRAAATSLADRLDAGAGDARVGGPGEGRFQNGVKGKKGDSNPVCLENHRLSRGDFVQAGAGVFEAGRVER